MIITDKFVLLNFPKTGSTFARTVIKKLHRYNDWTARNPLTRQFKRLALASGIYGFRELATPRMLNDGRMRIYDQHGTWRDMPDKYKRLPVVMVVRNPFDKIVSEFHFGWLQANLTHIGDTPVKDLFPAFPELTFNEFLEVKDALAKFNLRDIEPKTLLGWETIQFIKMTFRDPVEAFATIDQGYIDRKEFIQDLPENLTLLRNENLNEELGRFLRKVGYSDHATEFIWNHPRVYPSGGEMRDEREFLKYFSADRIAWVRAQEHVLLSILINFGIEY